MRRTLASLMLFAGVAGCSSDEPGTAVTLQRLATDARPLSYYSGYREPKRFVVRDRETWVDVWTQIWKLQSPKPDLPAIDFDKEMVLVAALGERPSSGYSILIDSAQATVDQLSVSVRVVSPGSGCAVLTVMTQPVDVASVPRLDVGVQFVERSETLGCN